MHIVVRSTVQRPKFFDDFLSYVFVCLEAVLISGEEVAFCLERTANRIDTAELW